MGLPNGIAAKLDMDLSAPAEFSAAQLANPDRLMIELRRAAPKPPAETVAPQTAPPVKTEPLPVKPPVQVGPVPKAQPAADVLLAWSPKGSRLRCSHKA